MKKSEFKCYDKVVVTKTTTQFFKLENTKEESGKKKNSKPEFVEKSVVTKTNSIATIVNKKYERRSVVSEGKEEEVMYDGWVYFCDDGQAYYPGVKSIKSGIEELIELRLTNEQDLEDYK